MTPKAADAVTRTYEERGYFVYSNTKQVLPVDIYTIFYCIDGTCQENLPPCTVLEFKEPADTAAKRYDVYIAYGEDKVVIANQLFMNGIYIVEHELTRAYKQFYGTYQAHEQTLAALYAGSVKQDIFNARVRGFDTALDAALYRDDVPRSVYTGLIDAVHKAFPALHRYYALRKKILGVDELRHYDVYVPLVGSVKTHKTYEEAAAIVRDALAPLGEEYVKTIYAGITTDRWVDRYENKGKRSGAFSSGLHEEAES